MKKHENDSEQQESGLSYLEAGVDIEAGNELVERIKPAVKKTFRPEVLTGLGGFGGLFQMDPKRWKEPVLVSGTDGVGTKLMLARQMNCHDSIGIDLVAMCVNDILTCGAEPLFFLDYFACGTLHLDQAQAVIEGIAEGCAQAGCALIGGETAEMPGMYDEGEYDLAGFSVGAVERSSMIDGSTITAGQRLLGLASSGPHSNGYSLIRKVIERSGDSLDAELTSDGQVTARQNDSDELSLGQQLIAPTRIYVRAVLDMLGDGGISGMAHITGGGLTENIVRVLPEHLGIEVDVSSWQRPGVFQWLQREGGISESEMLKTFNCGIGMVLIADSSETDHLVALAASHDIECFDVGCVTEDGSSGRVNYLA